MHETTNVTWTGIITFISHLAPVLLFNLLDSLEVAIDDSVVSDCGPDRGLAPGALRQRHRPAVPHLLQPVVQRLGVNDVTAVRQLDKPTESILQNCDLITHLLTY